MIGGWHLPLWVQNLLGAAAPAPSLSVTINGTPVSDGGTYTANSLEAGVELTITVVLTNDGTDTLTVSSYAASSIVNATVDTTGSPATPFTIEPDATASLILGVVPTANGPVSFVVTIVSDDPVRPEFVFAVGGMVGVPTPLRRLKLFGGTIARKVIYGG